MRITCIPAFKDNYFWIIEDGNDVAVVDPGESRGIFEWCEKANKKIDKILLTHHHSDHCGGVAELKLKFNAKVFASIKYEKTIPNVDFWLTNEDKIPIGSSTAISKETPGHTPGHIAFWIPNQNVLFVGDTLFAMGCGRLFGGSADQMWASLLWMKNLPSMTKVYCAHEYTLGNLKFVKHLFENYLNKSQNQFNCEFNYEFNYELILAREKKELALRKNNHSTVPFTLEEELATNPFLWCDDTRFAQCLGLEGESPATVFQFVRNLKNDFH